jgi:hypothetical protein
VSLLDRFGARPAVADARPAVAPSAGRGPYPTKALGRFLSALTARETPVLVDLGPVVGANVSFFGEQLGCKLVIEDVFADLDRRARAGTLEGLPEAIASRFDGEPESVDGVLCWDVLDYLDRPAAQELAGRLMRRLRSGGALFGLFSTLPVAGQPPGFTKYVVADPDTLEYRPYASVCARRAVLQNRDIVRLFPDLRVAESYLLKNRITEVLFRKPADIP